MASYVGSAGVLGNEQFVAYEVWHMKVEVADTVGFHDLGVEQIWYLSVIMNEGFMGIKKLRNFFQVLFWRDFTE